MIEVATLLKDTINKSAAEEFRHCVDHTPHGAAWYVVSDYCFDDSQKEADVATFSVIPNHDKTESILEYLRTFAPKDIKGSRTSSYGFLQYVNLPIVFHFSFVLRKEDDYLKGVMPMARIREYLTGIADFTRSLQANSPTRRSYFDAVLTRISAFERDLERKSFSQRLGRKVILTSILCGMVCYYLALFNQAGQIALVPDRDAMTSVYDGLYYDFALALFTREYGNTVFSDKATLDMPTFHFVVPDASGKNYLDDLIRVPDYLAGTLAEYGLNVSRGAKPKYEDVLFDSLSNSPNHAIILLQFEGRTLTCRRAKFVL